VSGLVEWELKVCCIVVMKKWGREVETEGSEDI